MQRGDQRCARAAAGQRAPGASSLLLCRCGRAPGERVAWRLVAGTHALPPRPGTLVPAPPGEVEVVEPPAAVGPPKITIIPSPPPAGASAAAPKAPTAAPAASSSGVSGGKPAAAAAAAQQQQGEGKKDMGPIAAVAGVPAPNKIRCAARRWPGAPARARA